MCHGRPIEAFPAPQTGTPFEKEVAGFAYGPADSEHRLAVLPDIYGCTPFYRQLSVRYAAMGAHVKLIDPFHKLGLLEEDTREAAFERRHRLADKAFLEAFEKHARSASVTGILGFCLGGLYIFELARRDMPAALVGLYGFPQGMKNHDPLPVPFDYLPAVSRDFVMLMPGRDASVGPENVARLAEMASRVPSMDLTVYPDAGHGFLPQIGSRNPAERADAEDALKRMDTALLTGARAQVLN
jgi:carboxymethylenebutenolidase